MSLPTYAAHSKSAKTFEAGDTVRFPTAHETKRFRIIEARGRNRDGSWLFWVEDLRTGEVKVQGFGSQQMWVVEE